MAGNANPVVVSDRREHVLEAVQRRFDSEDAELLQKEQEASIKRSNGDAEEKGQGKRKRKRKRKRKVSSLFPAPAALEEETDKLEGSSDSELLQKEQEASIKRSNGEAEEKGQGKRKRKRKVSSLFPAPAALEEETDKLEGSSYVGLLQKEQEASIKRSNGEAEEKGQGKRKRKKKRKRKVSSLFPAPAALEEETDKLEGSSDVELLQKEQEASIKRSNGEAEEKGQGKRKRKRKRKRKVSSELLQKEQEASIKRSNGEAEEKEQGKRKRKVSSLFPAPAALEEETDKLEGSSDAELLQKEQEASIKRSNGEAEEKGEEKGQGKRKRKRKVSSELLQKEQEASIKRSNGEAEEKEQGKRKRKVSSLFPAPAALEEETDKLEGSSDAELLQKEQEASIKRSNGEAEEKGQGKRKVSSLFPAPAALEEETDKLEGSSDVELLQKEQEASIKRSNGEAEEKGQGKRKRKVSSLFPAPAEEETDKLEGSSDAELLQKEQEASIKRSNGEAEEKGQGKRKRKVSSLFPAPAALEEETDKLEGSSDAELLQKEQEASIKRSNGETEEKGQGKRKRKVSSLFPAPAALEEETDKLEGSSSSTPLPKEGNLEVSEHTPSHGTPGASDAGASGPEYSQLCLSVHENLLTSDAELSSKEGFVVDKILHEFLQHGDNALKYMLGSRFKKLDNWLSVEIVQGRGSLFGACNKASHIHSKRSKRHMSMKQHRKQGSFTLPHEFHKFDIFKPMHEMWKDYIVQLFKSAARSLQTAHCILTADLHGAILLVVECKVTSFTGASGIMVRETAETFGIITQDDKFRVVPKRGSIFVFQAGYCKTWNITIHGDKFTSRNLNM